MKDLNFANIENWTDPPEEADEDFICPCCGATFLELIKEVGLKADGSRKPVTHDHHDHIRDGLKGLINFGASPDLVESVKCVLTGFVDTVICHRCNAADSGLLKQRLIARTRPELRGLVSFPPSAIRAGVIRVPGGKHVFNENAGDTLDSELDRVIRRAEMAADLINGIRNAVIGADQRELGGIIDAVLETFLRDGYPLEIRHEVLGPLSWTALTEEFRWADNRWAPPCDLTGGPVRGDRYLHDFHTGETIGGSGNLLPEGLRSRFVQILTFGKHAIRGAGFIRVLNRSHITEFSEVASGAFSCGHCTPGSEGGHYVCVHCQQDARLVRNLLCVADWRLIPERALLSCVSWDETMTVRTINMARAVDLFWIASGEVRDSVLDLVRAARPRSLKDELSELILKSARTASTLPDFLERLSDQGVFPELNPSPCGAHIDWVRFTYEGQKFKQGEVHFGPGEIRAYGLAYDPATDAELIAPFLYEWRSEKR